MFSDTKTFNFLISHVSCKPEEPAHKEAESPAESRSCLLRVGIGHQGLTTELMPLFSRDKHNQSILLNDKILLWSASQCCLLAASQKAGLLIKSVHRSL